jgi:hypothetical protein
MISLGEIGPIILHRLYHWADVMTSLGRYGIGQERNSIYMHLSAVITKSSLVRLAREYLLKGKDQYG